MSVEQLAYFTWTILTILGFLASLRRIYWTRRDNIRAIRLKMREPALVLHRSLYHEAIRRTLYLIVMTATPVLASLSAGPSLDAYIATATSLFFAHMIVVVDTILKEFLQITVNGIVASREGRDKTAPSSQERR